MSLSLSFFKLFSSSKTFLNVRYLSLTHCTSKNLLNNCFFCISHIYSKNLLTSCTFFLTHPYIKNLSVSSLQQNSFLRFVTFVRLTHRGITFLLNFIIDFHARFSLIASTLFFNRFLN
jgi:hypothetical protein